MNDDFNFDGKPARGSGSRAPMQMWDMLSILVLVITAGLVLFFAFIFINPDSALNPLRPGAGGSQLPTSTPTPLQLAPTWTASPTLEMTPTDTPRPTFTAIATDTPFSLIPPTRTPKPTSTPKAPFSAVSITFQDSTVYHPGQAACSWAGIGGAVLDANNSPVIGMVVVLRGSLDNKALDEQTVSGINKEYGPSGFEFVLGSAPVATNKTLYIQLVDQSSVPLSDKIFVTTSSDCTKNLVLVRLKKNK